MDGVFIARALLIQRASLVTLLGGAAKVRAGVLPETTLPPAIGLTEVSTVERRVVNGKPGDRIKVTSRTQATVIGKDYPQKEQVLTDAEFACTNYVGLITGVLGRVTCAVLGRGPVFTHEVGWVAQSFDLLITFDKQAP